MRSRVRGTGRILIYLDEWRRDVPVSLALGRLFELAGYQVVFSTRRTTALFLRDIVFDAVLVPHLQHIPDQALPRIAAQSKIYMFPAEGAQLGEWPLFTHYAGGGDPARWEQQIAATTRFFLWGDYSRRILQQTGRFRDEQLMVAGAPRMDFFLVESALAEQTPRSPHTIGGVTHLTLTNSYNRFTIFGVVDQERHDHNIKFATTRNLEDWYWIETAQVRVWLECFDQCQRRRESICLRVHPCEDLTSYHDLLQQYGHVLRFDGQDLTFQSWLERIGILLGYNSTTFFEAVATKTPAISLEGLLGSRLAEHRDGFAMSHYPIMDFVEQPRSWEALFDLIQRVRRGQWSAESAYGSEAHALLKDMYAWPRTTSTIAVIANTVVRDLEETGRREGRTVERLAQGLACLKAHLLEVATFTLRRDRVTSAWFPLALRRLERQFADDIARYLRAAKRFPATAAGSPAVRSLAQEHLVAV